MGAWEDAEKIPFDELPDTFVLKANHGSSMNLFVQDKSQLDRPKVLRTMKKWLKTNYCYENGFEMIYKDIKPMIIAEPLMKPEAGEDSLIDYKFYCFNGKPKYCQVVARWSKGNRPVWVDMNWQRLKGVRDDDPVIPAYLPDKPAQWEELKAACARLCEGIAFVRTDMYLIAGKPYFGEMTFTPSSGYIFYSDMWDRHMGDLWDITVPQVEHEIVEV